MELEEEEAASPWGPGVGVGAHVRVLVGERHREVAVVSALDAGGAWVSIPALGGREKLVPAADVLPLLEFEVAEGGYDGGDNDALLQKKRGNALFKLFDYTAALGCYRRGLQVMRARAVCSVGADVLHTGPGGGVRSGYVSDVTNVAAGGGDGMDVEGEGPGGAGGDPTGDARVDLCYNAGEPDEAADVPARDVHPAFALDALEATYLYCGLMSNTARCLAKKSQPGLALDRVNTCIAILKHLITEHNLSQAALGREGWEGFKGAIANAYTLRGHIHIQMSKFRMAMNDANVVLTRIDADSKKARDLRRACEKKAQYAQRQNKKLARDVSKWVEEAMAAGQENGGDAAEAEAKGGGAWAGDCEAMEVKSGGWTSEPQPRGGGGFENDGRAEDAPGGGSDDKGNDCKVS